MSMRIKALFSLTAFLFIIPIFVGAESAAVSGPQTEEVTQKVYPCVVKVEAKNMVRKVATGVVIDRNGHIVTTALITPRDEEIIVTTSRGEKVEAEFKGMDSETHLAVIQVKDKNLAPITMGQAKELSPGAWIGVVSISPENTPLVTQGIVSSVSPEAVRLNVWVSRGMSGSPVVNGQGQMVGLLRGVYVDEQPIVFEFQQKEVVGSGYVLNRAEAPASGMAMAVPVDVVDFVAAEIMEKGKVARGWLGVRIWLNEDNRVEITEVEKDSPAELAGLEEGDIILEFKGEEIGDSESLQSMIRKSKPGETVTMKIERKGETQDVKVKLGELTQEDIWSEFESKFPGLFRREKNAPLVTRFAPKPDFFRFGFEQRKFIGISVQELNPELSEFFGIDKGTGILISSIEKDGPADKAGLKVGDVIVTADGKRVERTQDLVGLIQDKEKGDKITIEYIRDKKKRNVEVEVEEEEGSIGMFSPGVGRTYPDTWGNYQDVYRDQSRKLAETYKKLGEDQYKTYMERQKKMNEEVMKQWEKQRKENEKNYQEALKTYRINLAKKRGIRV
jgi:serine protease Do